ncbi:6928_t:CDS:2 [Ambispora gerdemannii]|uniref:6928_t:CDS:1 n=1 Tax=Ambispora gerdemannii TaxID=144530 RepID=A0A9N9CKC1_9GLOM|nr:6928_t:CDS:2 [Ambispora gerdemannii]
MTSKQRSNSFSSTTISDASEETVTGQKALDSGELDERFKDIFGGSEESDLSDLDLESVDLSSDEEDSKQKAKKARIQQSPVKQKLKRPDDDEKDKDYIEEGEIRKTATATATKSKGKKKRASHIEISDKYVVDSDEEENEKGKEAEIEERKSKSTPRKIKRKKSEGKDDDDDDFKSKELTPLEAIRKQVDKHFDEILKSNSPRKKRRKNDIELDQYNDDLAASLYIKMIQAADKDIEYNKINRPSFAKSDYFPEAYAILTKANMTETLLEHNILEAIRAWLEPLPDGNLPPIGLQEPLLDFLDRLPVTLEQLRSSQIGFIIRFYNICPGIAERIQRKAEKLVQKWSRLIFNLSDDYRNRPVETVVYDPEAARHVY